MNSVVIFVEVKVKRATFVMQIQYYIRFRICTIFASSLVSFFIDIKKNVSGYICDHGSLSWERDTASSRGRYGEQNTHATMLRGEQAKHKSEH